MMFWSAIRAIGRALWGAIGKLVAPPDPISLRLRRLRRIYRTESAAGLHSRHVRDALRGVVAPAYQTHYDRLLRVERVIANLLIYDIPPGVPAPDLMLHVCALTERVARWLEHLQHSDELLTLYAENSTERELIDDARQRLLLRIDEALALQESVPVRLFQLSAASTGHRDAARLRETLLDLNARLEGMTESYEDLHYNYTKERK
jgi:hypothetical protein